MSGVKKIDYEKPSPYLDTGPCVSHNAQRSVKKNLLEPFHPSGVNAQRSVKKLVRTVPTVWCQKPVRNPHTFNPKDQTFLREISQDLHIF